MGFIAIPHIEDSEQCYYYHSIDFPDGSSVVGDWDLRNRFDEYTGGVKLKDKVVLDVGTASGFLAFEAEKRGAEVISLDMPVDGDWDVVPGAKSDVVNVEDQLLARLNDANACKRIASIQRMRKGFFYAHSKMNSSVRFYESGIYGLSADVGFVDVSIVGSILLHLRDPFLALQRVASVTKERIVIADLCQAGFVAEIGQRPVLEFLPSASCDNPNAWWRLSPLALTRMLDVLGFSVEFERTSMFLFKGRENRVCTLVARRVRV